MKIDPLRSILRSPAGRRWSLAGFVAVSVLTSLGHGGLPTNLGELAVDVINPEEPGCAAGTLTAKLAGNNQTGIADAPLGQALQLDLSCLSKRERNATFPFGSTVKWAVTSGGGKVNGQAELSKTLTANFPHVLWHLGATMGTQTVVATVDGQAYMFTAAAVPPVAGGTCTEGVSTTGTNMGIDRIVQGNEHWTLAGSPYRGQSVRVIDGGTLTIDAGVRACLSRLETGNGVLKAQGTAQAPVQFNDQQQAKASMVLNFFQGSSSAPPRSELKFVQGYGVRSLMAVDHSVVIEDSHFRAEITPQTVAGCSTVRLTQEVTGLQPNVVRRTVFAGYGDPAATCNAPAVWLNELVPPVAGNSVFSGRVTGSRTEGLRVTASNFIGTTTNPAATTGWVLEQCDISGSATQGVVLKALAARISGCSITNNGGLGIDNQISGRPAALARGNWWGHPAGPTGPGADGVSTGVDASQALPAAPELGY